MEKSSIAPASMATAPSRLRKYRRAAVLVALAVAAIGIAALPASAASTVYVGTPVYVYPPPAVVYAPRPVYVAPAPVYVVPPPAQVVVAPTSTCRSYQTTVVVGGVPHQVAGTACRQPDGSWRVVR
jgi:hypothetical protein